MRPEFENGFQFLAENSTDVICRAGLDMALHYASAASLSVLGWQPGEMLGKRLDTFVVAEDAAALVASLAAAHASGQGSPAVIVRMPKRDGTLVWIEIKHCLLRDSATGRPTEMVAVLRDVAERKPLAEMLSALALTDSLTGLSTHSAFLKALEREWNSALRSGSPISLLRLNFNGFQQFQSAERPGDRDNCLRRAAAVLLGALRVTDLAARYGAEDIAIILPFTDSVGATKVAEKVRSVVQLLRSSDSVDPQGSIKVSMGLTTATARSGGAMRMPELLLLAANHALQKAQREEPKAFRPTASCATPSIGWKMSMPA